MLQKIISMCLLVILCSFSQFREVRAELNVGISAEPYPPFSYRNAEGKRVGWEVDFTTALCEAMSEKCKIVDVAWDGLIASLVTGKIDMIISSMAITPKRRAMIDFSRAYYNSSAVLVGTLATATEINPATLAGKTIGVQSATIYAEYVEKHYDQLAQIKYYQTQDEVWQDLAAGRLDLALAEAIVTKDFMATRLARCCTEILHIEVGKEMGLEGVGVGLRKGDEALRQKINVAITKLLTEKIPQKISDKFGIKRMLSIPQP